MASTCHPPIPLSVLDVSPVTSETSGAAALHNTLDLARLADRLGFTRYWLAEHHNAPSVASSAPDIMTGQIAAATRRIRVGSGGVMLSNHAPLVVTERFKVLEALFPGRIDLGLGRAAGADPATFRALRRSLDAAADDFPNRVQELIALETREFPEGHPLLGVHAMPKDVPLPPLWLLGSTGQSAQLAGELGLGFAFAHHFATYDAATAIWDYRDRFRPSRWRGAPYAILAVHLICADTDEEAEHLATAFDLYFLRSSRRESLPLPSLEVALAYPYTPEDRERIAVGRSRLFVGGAATIRDRLAPVIRSTGADELMVISLVFDHGARLRSYECTAEGFGLALVS